MEYAAKPRRPNKLFQVICVSVVPSSIRLDFSDLFNASKQCDLIELYSDHFLKTPDIGVLVKSVEKPSLISCRRRRDGGRWKGSKEDKIKLLRNAIVAEPAYVEPDLEIADQIPRYETSGQLHQPEQGAGPDICRQSF